MKKYLSIVSTYYNGEHYLKEFHERISLAAKKITLDYEIILINDGSYDRSYEITKSIADRDPATHIINLSKNFGHHKAMMCGLSHAKGDLVFIIDSDLEEDPELLISFYEHMSNTSADVIYGVQKTRKGRFFERASGAAFWKLINALSPVKLPQNMSTIRLMTKEYVSSVIQYTEKVLFIHGIWMLAGYKQLPILITKKSKGTTTYTLPIKIKLAIDSIVSFSDRPLEGIFYLGAGISSLSLTYISFILVRKIFFSGSITGWSSLIASVWFFGGLILLCLGVIGMYLSRIYLESKNRPLVIEKEHYKCNTLPDNKLTKGNKQTHEDCI